MTTDITVANQDWDIISDVKDALTDAALSGVAIFDRVAVVSERPELESKQKIETTVAVIIYAGTKEDRKPEGEIGGFVAMEIVVAAWTNESGLDESARIQEALRLKNCAVNAVENTPPSDAVCTTDHNYYHEKLEWGSPEIDVSEPWTTCTIRLEVGRNLASATSH